jgi:hypothetical protein
MAAFLDNCRFNPTLGGTTDWTYSSAVAGYQSPAAAGAVNGRLYKYFAIDASNNWELGEGAYNTTGPVLARTTITANSLGTTAKISFAAAPQVAIVAIKADLLSVEEANSFTAAQRQQARDNITVGLRGRLAGLTLSTAGSSATFGIALGEAADSTAVDLLKLASAYTKTTSAWALGTAAGSLDTGAIANSTWYHAHLIKRVDTGVVDVLVSLSATAPTLPTNYTLFRRIGSMKTNGSSQWTAFTQNGDEFSWLTSILDVNAVTSSSTPGPVTLTVPAGVVVNALFASLCVQTGASYIYYYALDRGTQASNASTGNVSLGAQAAQQDGAHFNIKTNTSAQIGVVAQNAGTSYYISTYGWIDRRGRD